MKKLIAWGVYSFIPINAATLARENGSLPIAEGLSRFSLVIQIAASRPRPGLVGKKNRRWFKLNWVPQILSYCDFTTITAPKVSEWRPNFIGRKLASSTRKGF